MQRESGEERRGKYNVLKYIRVIRKEKYIERQNDVDLIGTWIDENKWEKI